MDQVLKKLKLIKKICLLIKLKFISVDFIFMTFILPCNCSVFKLPAWFIYVVCGLKSDDVTGSCSPVECASGHNTQKNPENLALVWTQIRVIRPYLYVRQWHFYWITSSRHSRTTRRSTRRRFWSLFLTFRLSSVSTLFTQMSTKKACRSNNV